MSTLPARWIVQILACAAGFALAVMVMPWARGNETKPPAPASASAPIPSKVISWDQARSNRGTWGEMRIHFAGDQTFANKAAFAAIAVVEPGKAVHLAHRHAEEEFLFITEGSGVWHLDGKDFPARKGDVLFVEPWVFHGLKNTGDKPLTFAVVKYEPKGVTAPPRPDDRKDEIDNP